MQKNRFYTNKIFIVAVIILLLIFLQVLGMLSPIKSTVFRITQPISSMFYQGSTFFQKALSITKSDKDKLSEENNKLIEQINALLGQKSELEQLRDENDSLRKIIDFTSENKHEYKVAKIISRDSDKSREAVVINRGLNDGIVKNHPVLNEEGVIIGKINKVEDEYSTVLFLIDNHAKLAVTVLNNERTTGLLEGELGLVTRVDFIPQDALLTVGDLVVSSGSEDRVPKGLVVGQVEEIYKQPNELFKSAKIKQYVNYDHLDLVTIIIQSHD